MVKEGLTNFFESYLKKEPIFVSKKVLQSNYTPEALSHRDEQIQQVADILAPSLRLDKPSNLFIYGKTGTGKTVTIKFTTSQIMAIAEKRNIPLKVLYINCKLKRVADTEYRLIAELARAFDKDIPATGLPTDEVYKLFFNAVNEKEQLLILILDEIDQLVKKAGDEILYNLTRINSELKQAQISIIGISNDLIFVDHLDPRVKSSLSEEEIVFPPYNALQIQDILRQRAANAFKQGVLEPGVIEKCAAYAAREHGDARRALELLRVAGEIAERKCCSTVKISHIDDAEEKIERDRLIDIVTTQPKQHQATLYSVLSLGNKDSSIIFTGEVYEIYKGICKDTGLRPLTQRRVSDVIGELDMLGIINAKVISKGRYGRTREISLAIPASTVPKVQQILKDALF
ncbi:ORC1-type DNA replication protein [Candidatus Woesearchaeota archaeon]|nr:ORC1-type DNA replication protein [Candidatus Woesearchaeota archaeon]MBW3021295.1 ORC1-type DNA replication protein [Candidatus Woesearchaeota archaeon]